MPAAILGPLCNQPALTITPLANSYEIPVVSWSADSTDLSDKQNYPFFARNVYNGNIDSEWFINVLLHFNWKYINVLSDGYDPFSDEFYSLAIEYNITIVNNIVTPKSTVSTFASQLQLIKDSGTSIILTKVDNNEFYNAADILLRDAINMGMFGSKYIWIMDNTQNYLFNTTTGDPLTRLDGVISQQELDANIYLPDLSQQIIDMWTPNYTSTLNISFDDTQPPVSIDGTLDKHFLDALLFHCAVIYMINKWISQWTAANSTIQSRMPAFMDFKEM